MAEINDLLYQLRLADQSTTQLFEKRLGISLTRYQILQYLLEQAPCNQIAVQERLQIDPAALTRHFKILEREGFVHRSRNPKNQREILIHLTDTAYNRLVKHPPSPSCGGERTDESDFDCSRTRAIFLPAGQISIWH